MGSRQQLFVASLVLWSVAAVSAFADNGNHYAYGHSAGVPGPIAGAGIPFALFAGAAYLVRRWTRR